MVKQLLRAAACLVAVLVPTLKASPALAHESREVGPFTMTVGFGIEPAYAGIPNSAQLSLSRGDEPVVELGGELQVEIAFGEETLALDMSPSFVPGVFGEPGTYEADFVPTRPGEYVFHFTGTIQGEDIDEVFTSGEDTFGPMEDPGELAFPVRDPSLGELAERIDREIPRIAGAVEDRAAALEAENEELRDDAASARTLALAGLFVGAVGLLLAIVALSRGRRRPAEAKG